MRAVLKQAAPRAGKHGTPARCTGFGPAARESLPAFLQRNLGGSGDSIHNWGFGGQYT